MICQISCVRVFTKGTKRGCLVAGGQIADNRLYRTAPITAWWSGWSVPNNMRSVFTVSLPREVARYLRNLRALEWTPFTPRGRTPASILHSTHN